LSGSGIEAELSALRTDKKRLEELISSMKSDQQQKVDDGSDEVVRQLKSQTAELEKKLAAVSAELDRYRASSADNIDGDLVTLRKENERLDTLVSYLRDEVEKHKDAAHEQRIRALDLKHELREVRIFCNLHFLFLCLSFSV